MKANIQYLGGDLSLRNKCRISCQNISQLMPSHKPKQEPKSRGKGAPDVTASRAQGTNRCAVRPGGAPSVLMASSQEAELKRCHSGSHQPLTPGWRCTHKHLMLLPSSSQSNVRASPAQHRCDSCLLQAVGTPGASLHAPPAVTDLSDPAPHCFCSCY